MEKVEINSISVQTIRAYTVADHKKKMFSFTAKTHSMEMIKVHTNTDTLTMNQEKYLYYLILFSF